MVGHSLPVGYNRAVYLVNSVSHIFLIDDAITHASMDKSLRAGFFFIFNWNNSWREASLSDDLVRTNLYLIVMSENLFLFIMVFSLILVHFWRTDGALINRPRCVRMVLFQVG